MNEDLRLQREADRIFQVYNKGSSLENKTLDHYSLLLLTMIYYSSKLWYYEL